MRLIRWPGEELPLQEPSVVTLGVFDGVHRGHAALIRQVVEAAGRRDCRAALVTFDRHPGALLRARTEPAITSLEHRIRLFRGFGVDLCVVVRFTEDVASMTAAEFLRRVFHDLLSARLLILGDDCRFGRGREGDVALCRRLGPELGFEVRTVASVEVDGRRVSSTAIREAILAGESERAESLLGRPFSLYGTVVRGEGRGHRLGYPTANLDLHNETIPPDGVYAGWVFTDGEPLAGVVSVGRRATFHCESDAERVVEVHLLDRGEDLYGRDIEVQFVERLRGQQTFESAEALKAQIARDVATAREML